MYTYINILCEGPSEERFVKELLTPYFAEKDIYINPITLGGVSTYAKIRNELKRIGKDSSKYLTTMLDYYKLPQDTPGVKNVNQRTVVAIAETIEQEMYLELKEELSCKSYIPFIMMHEYEALMFSNVHAFEKCDGFTNKMIRELQDINDKYETPEYINNSEQTAPSKRILRVYPQYQKVSDGIIIAKNIGLPRMMQQCEHFRNWIHKIERLNEI